MSEVDSDQFQSEPSTRNEMKSICNQQMQMIWLIEAVLNGDVLTGGE